MGIELSLLAVAAVAILVFIAVLIYAVLDKVGFFDRHKGRDSPASLRYPCLTDNDCGATWGLGDNYVCDPKLKQCRIRSYIEFSCKTDTDCLQATPSCVQSPVLSVGRMCSHIPYTHADLFGDPVRECNSGLVRNPLWNFCQYNLGGTCKTSDDCAQGACVNATCQFLSGYDVCTVGDSYGNHQCPVDMYCTTDLINTHRCQPTGKSHGDDGAFCATNKDCKNGDCYRVASADPVGICASHIALVGMDCQNSAECAPGLDCIIASGQISGTCVLNNPAAQKDATHCPEGQYTFLQTTGCSGAISPVPCSTNEICKNQCEIGNVNALVLGVLGPDQIWRQLYPQPDQNDTLGFLTSAFQLAADGKTIILDPHFTFLISANFLTRRTPENYPTITLAPPPPALPEPKMIGDIKACPDWISGVPLASSFSAQSSANIVFRVEYDPSAASTTWRVRAMFLNSSIGNFTPLMVNMNSDDLFADFYVDKNPYATPVIPFDKVYVNCNYHGRTTLRAWPLSPGEVGHVPALWGSAEYWLAPPPLLPIQSGIVGNTYLDRCLRFGQDSSVSVEPLQVFIHFLYYPGPLERVVSWKFNVMPSLLGGGLSTLVGLFEVEKPRDSGPGRTRRLVVSTLTLHTMTPTEAIETATFALASGSMWSYRRNPVYASTSLGLNVYASVYSFVLVDFEYNWPFTTKLLGPPSTQSDTAGLCEVTFTDTSHGNTVMTQLAQTAPSVPGYMDSDSYAVFTPRSYTRTQAVSTVRTSQWTSLTLFGTNTPALLDSDLVVIGTAGSSDIVGLTLTYEASDGQPQTLLITMRFGDANPTSLYSLPQLSAGIQSYAQPTRMYSFFLTPQPEETGGGLILDFPVIAKQPFNTPQVSLNPTLSQDISSWVTPPFAGDNGILTDTDGRYVAHINRTPWGAEVFTACLIPTALYPPVRFFRTPVVDAATRSARGGDDVWVWGRSSPLANDIKFVPIFFDNMGTILSHMQGQPDWISSAGITCPPSAAQAVAGMDHTFQLNNASKTPYQPVQWNIRPDANIIFYPTPHPHFSSNPLQITGRMCQTQGYQDGILYRARPFVFAATAGGDNLPAGVKAILDDPTQNAIFVNDLQSMALALSSDASHSYQTSLPLIGIGSIDAILGSAGSIHTLIPNLFDRNTRDIIWVGSESGVPLLPGGYRTLPCPVNPRAFTTLINSAYPAGCVDYGLAQAEGNARKPLPICIIYRYTASPQAPQLEMHLYDIRATARTLRLITDTVVQTNGGLTTMADLYLPPPPAKLPGAPMGYPGFNGGPAVVYTPCS